MDDFYRATPEQQAGRLQLLAERAVREWKLPNCTISLIKYRENAVFKVDVQGGRRFALRIHRPGYHEDAALQSELLWIDALAKAGLEVPGVIASTNGEFCVPISVDAVPESRMVDLFSWVDGEQLGSSEEGVRESAENLYTMYQTIGRIAAQLHNITTAWQQPDGFERHAWDLEGLVGDQPFWGRFWELESLTEQQRELLLSARERVRVELEQYGQPEGLYSMIHADFVPENLLVDGDKVRLIDFDDAGFGWHMFELATALYFVHTEPHYDSARRGLIDGYRECRALDDRDWNRLDLFLLARSFTYLGWVHTRAETETAKELTPMLVEMACNLATCYLSGIEE